MDGQRVAVIDLGTNTFNLLIAKVTATAMEQEYFEKVPVKLGRGGIGKGIITPDAQARALRAMHRYRRILDEKGASTLLAYGTSALRSARNSGELLDRIRRDTGIGVQVISGDEEARLIYLGVRESITPGDTFLILDIGGGSVEFILAHPRQGPLWQQSFPLGMARIIEQFTLSDPATHKEEQLLIRHFDRSLSPLWEALRHHPSTTLVGASGTFDTLRALGEAQKLITTTNTPAAELPLPVFDRLYRQLIRSTTAEREKMEGMEPFRIEMIVPATIFVNFILSKTGIPRLYQTTFALKEGAIVDWREKHREQLKN